VSPTSKLQIGWFATGTGTTSPKLLRAVLEAIRSGYLLAEIAVAFCNREPGEDRASDEFHSIVREAGIPLVTLSDRRFRREHGGAPARKGAPLPTWRAEFDREVIRLLRPYPFEVGMLAGYKLIFAAEASAEWSLLNLHPAPPGGPKGIWQDVIWDLITSHAIEAGVMIHLATPQLDEGPPISYCTYPIRGGSFESLWTDVENRSIESVRAEEGEESALFQAIRASGIAREVPLVVETLRAFSEGRVSIQGGRVVDAAGVEVSAVNLTAVIESLVAR
jgi:phosphoribosylglycinamide formyltransferase-1